MDIFEASRTGNLDRVKELIDSVDVNARYYLGNTALIGASGEGHLEVVKELIAHGADVNALNNIGDTALMYASDYDHLEVVRELIARGADINIENKRGQTAYNLASDPEILDLLKPSMDIFEAVKIGNLRRVKELIASGVDVNARDGYDSTVLMDASRVGHLDIVNELLTHGADVNARTRINTTALMYASRSGHIEVVRELIARGANVNAWDNNGGTAFNFANNQEIRNLLSPLISMDIFDASNIGSLEKVKELIARGADVNQLSNDSWTALMYASRNGHLEVVRELIEHGADVNTSNNIGDTALMYASRNGHLEVVRELIEHDADVNARNVDGWTAFDFAQNQEIRNLLRPTPPPNNRKSIIITQTNEAIAADTSIPDDIKLEDFGCDVLLSGCTNQDNKIQDFINENPDNTIVIKMIDSPTKSRHFLYTRDDLIQGIQGSVVYPCLEANNIPGRDSNVITDLPLYSLATLIGVKVLIKKETFDLLLQNTGNLFVVINKHVFSYPTIASHNVVFESGSLVSGLHCNIGAEAEKLYNIKRVNLPIGGGYYKKFLKYQQKLKI